MFHLRSFYRVPFTDSFMMYYVAKNKGELAFTNFFTFYGIQNEVFPKNVKTNLPNFFGEIGSAFKDLRRNRTNLFKKVATIMIVLSVHINK
jgi:hypothetical protein